MNIIQRAIKSLRQQGLSATLVKVLAPLADARFDRKYGTQTTGVSRLDQFTIESRNRDRGARYEPSRVLPLRKMLAALQGMRPADSVLVDFGCGKGRVLLLAAQSGFRDVRGLEFAAELCELARSNWKQFQARTGITAQCRILQADVTDYVIQAEENVFFLFNPFDEVIFARVLENIAASLKTHPRRILIVINLPSPQYRQAIEQRPEFALARTFRFWGCDFSVYGNRA
jgi:SAM-dependent methyltransferase